MAVSELAGRYAEQLARLLPPGPLFQPNVGPNLKAVLEALALEFERVHGRVEQLLREQAPRSTSELLGDWERALGLPDNCAGSSSSTDVRRAAVLARLAVPGGNTRSDLVRLALTLGYPIDIEEHRPFRVGSRIGDRLNEVDAGWPWAFTVHAPVVTSRFFRAGSSSAGDALSTFSNAPLECNVRRVKPAQSPVVFAYDRAVHPAEYQPWGWYVVPPAIEVRAVFPPFVVQL